MGDGEGMRYPASEENWKSSAWSNNPIFRRAGRWKARPSCARHSTAGYDRYQAGGPEALEDRPSTPQAGLEIASLTRLRERIIDLALDAPEVVAAGTGPRRLHRQRESYFVSGKRRSIACLKATET